LELINKVQNHTIQNEFFNRDLNNNALVRQYYSDEAVTAYDNAEPAATDSNSENEDATDE
jgi:hypothetical protein